MNTSLTTDFAKDTGNPEPYLRAIAETGFTHIHWCHHWNTDFMYSSAEIDQIGAWLRELNLGLLDIHGSDGKEKRYASTREYERLAGVELVQNRIEMAAALGADAVVMHLPGKPEKVSEGTNWDALRRSLDALEPFARARHVRIALENGGDDSVEGIRALFAQYSPDYLALCYDCGHGNITGHGLDQLDELKDRLAVTHLHDNDGAGDQHNNPFTGTVNWQRLAVLLAASANKKPITLESNVHHTGMTEPAWLQQAYAAGQRLAQMVEEARI
jgi:sugar phosphate isomerase/epimerase